MSKFIQRFRAFFASEAKTVGVSPKALAVIIAAVITAAVNFVLSKLHLTLQDVADFIGTSPQYITTGELVLGTLIAGWLLGPGNVVVPPAQLTEGSDARLSPEATANIQ